MRSANRLPFALPIAFGFALALSMGACTDDDGEVFTGGPGGPGGPGTADETGAPGQTGVPGQTGMPGQTGVPGQTGMPGQTGVPGQTGMPGQTGVPGQTGMPGQTGTTSGPGTVIPGMTLSEDLSAIYEGNGGSVWARRGPTDIGEGTLSAEGNLQLDLYDSAGLEDVLEPVMVEFPDGFSMFACLPEVRDQVPDGARFVADRALLYNGTDDEGDFVLGFLGLTTQTEGDLSINDSWPGGGDTHAMWIFSTEAMTLDATCDAGFIDVTLEEGWNEVYFLDTPPNIREQWTGDRPAELGWYFDAE